MRLSDATLAALPDSVRIPRYDRSELASGIVHIGVGNFHRAHQAWYLHRLFDMGLDHEWAITGAGVRSYDRAQRERLAAQDWLTTLVELGPSGKSAEVVGSMIDYVPIEEGNGALVERMADEAIRIVGLTVTEGGYFIDPATNGFDAGHPDILHDSENPTEPRTAFGAIIAALRLRRDRDIGPFTGLSCDNLQGNGTILRQTVVSLARLSDPHLADWIDENCSFPNSMVDCIVPATGPKEVELVRALGIDDAAPVTHENFRQWVVEDDFCAGRPSLDRAGVILSDQVHAFETMKIRILNAGHQVIANPGELLSIETISGCMEHPQIYALFQKVAREEIAPHVGYVPGMGAIDYIELIGSRFSNTAIVDTTRRVAFDGSSRHTGFVLPTVRDGLQSGAPIDGLALVEALWARMCEGTREDGSVIEPNDPHWETLQSAARSAKHNPRAWIGQEQFYGDLGSYPRFADAFEKWLSMVWSAGCVAAINAYVGG